MRRATILLLIAAALWPRPQYSRSAIQQLRQWTITVTDDSGKFVRGLGMKDFLVEDNGIVQPISEFSEDPDIPVRVGLLIDAAPGPAVNGGLMKELGAIRIFLRFFARPGDEFVLTTNAHHEINETAGDASTIDRALLALYPTDVTNKALELHSRSMDFDEAIVQALEKTKRVGPRRQGLIVTTAKAWGLDFDKFIGKVRSAEVPIFIMNFPDWGTQVSATPPSKFSALLFEAFHNSGTLKLESQLSQIAEATGGRTEFFTLDQTHAVERVQVFAREASVEIRGQYLIGYSDTPSTTSLRNPVRIRLPKFPQYQIRMRPVLD